MIGTLSSLSDQAFAYASTVYENTLVELAIFVALVSLYFFARHVLLGLYARRLRKSLKLVLGGWGTRGKSGTERLKAGLMNAVGPSIVSKTTGCEAMFLIGTPFGGLTEMFLFRPYDKATIWEQFNLMKTSKGLKARVFLWECMGLNPEYVRVLQQDWMRDDIGTITNTYPDHEDIQGPAGRNIPEVMCEFIPNGSQVLTTEEEMLPILEEGAATRQAQMRTVGWKQAGLVHQDLLDRFPYEEHPYNIALVTAMGDELGLDHDYCVREMSDRVVADLGVLKTYPRSTINGRTLEFIMGMSANERFGAMGNWDRMGLAKHDLATDPEIFVSTVVNNRADRVPRSRVFARMLVHDVAADRHVLIGSNVEGLIGFIKEEWDGYAANLTLFEEGEDPLDLLAQLSRHQRIAQDQQSLDGLLAAMLSPQKDQIAIDDAIAAAKQGKLAEALREAGVAGHAAIADHYAAMEARKQALMELQEAVKRGGDQDGNKAALDAQLRELLGEAFTAKLLPVRDVYTKGEAIVRLVAESTPPGLTNRIMGMQNIKGTGLDWVYRWQAWETVAKACDQLRSEDPSEIERGYRALAAFQEFGILSDQHVRESVALARTKLMSLSNTSGPNLSGAQLDALEVRLAKQVAKQVEGQAQPDAGETPDSEPDDDANAARIGAFADSFINQVEGFIDPTDAVRRRKTSDKIYKALIAEQISMQRAAAELKGITSRQKGGWLSSWIKQRGNSQVRDKAA